MQEVRTPIEMDPLQSARFAGLRYVTDSRAGIRRKRAGKGFFYIDPQGRKVEDAAVLARIRALAIPPAWQDVWISPLKSGHLQATGRDAKGRKQYRYHPEWGKIRNQTKFDRMHAFASALPRIRKQLEEHLSLRGLPREKVLATVVKLLEKTLIRVGNEEYAKTNRSFGLTTLRSRHAKVSGEKLHFCFRGKGGQKYEISIRDRRLARIVRRCRELPGHELFQYTGDDGQTQKIDSEDVNDYLYSITGQEFTAKDFRTWAGTVAAALALREYGPSSTLSEARRNVSEAVRRAASLLGNTTTVCRRFYIHPGIIEGYMDGSLFREMGELVEEIEKISDCGLEGEELSVLQFLECELAKTA
jgi:DNA topoisomerase I